VVCRLYNTAVFSDVTLLRLLSYNDFKTYFGSHKTLSISWVMFLSNNNSIPAILCPIYRSTCISHHTS